MQAAGKVVISLGVLLILCGGLLLFWDRLPLLGKLPGDIVLQKGNTRVWLPLASCLIVSILLTVTINLVLRLFR